MTLHDGVLMACGIVTLVSVAGMVWMAVGLWLDDRRVRDSRTYDRYEVVDLARQSLIEKYDEEVE